uniref:15-hydroxyprostaglandin dehydrogenase [NAD(+)]-like n=1 Tax=Diabrotica virgifera virgifera TaxID=50390 RepID=A0A6P7F6P2_DIAVI
MVFNLKNKVAIVTGGADGIGLALVKQLLINEIKGVVIADINAENGKIKSKELGDEYGSDRVVFVELDVTDLKAFENAFDVALKHFKNVDILINNAGVGHDRQWEREVDINLKGTINGMVLGIENYLKNHKQGDEAVIMNLSSISVLQPVPIFPVYVGTKHAIVGLTRNWGHHLHYDRTKVRVAAICPGATDTSLLRTDVSKLCFNEDYRYMHQQVIENFDVQSANHVAREAMKVLEKAETSTVWVIENSQPPYEYKAPDCKEFKKNTLV